MPAPASDAFVFFGATGDLAYKQIFPALQALMRRDRLDLPIIGVAKSGWNVDQLKARARDSLQEHGGVDADAFAKLSARLRYIDGDYGDRATYERLRDALGHAARPLHYLAIPPSMFATVVEGLSKGGCATDARVVVEKPFGRDLASARALNEMIASYLDESQIYRIDHYLGKETVQNILVLRFGNSIFEPLWNRNHIEYVEITAAEDIGIEGRGAFYEQTGVVRDIIQNHLMQVMALVTMEVPASFKPDDIRDEKSQVLRSVRELTLNDVANYAVRGQYRGYREENGVAPSSQVPTFAAMRFMIDSWRWQGVPFYMRAGKKLAERLTEVSIHFRAVPLVLFKEEAAGSVLQPAVLTLRIQPHEGISLRFVAKVPGENIQVGNVMMQMTYADAFKRPISEAYERLLLDCMRGDATLFNRRDSVDRAWELIQPVLQVWEATPGVHIYEPGTAGPAAADEMMGREGHSWRELVKQG